MCINWWESVSYYNMLNLSNINFSSRIKLSRGTKYTHNSSYSSQDPGECQHFWESVLKISLAIYSFFSTCSYFTIIFLAIISSPLTRLTGVAVGEISKYMFSIAWGAKFFWRLQMQNLVLGKKIADTTLMCLMLKSILLLLWIKAHRRVQIRRPWRFPSMN